MIAEDDAGLESLLEYLKRARGFDFLGYKRGSLGRRISKRMQMVQIASFGDYIDYLEVHPEEFTELFNTILINVTGFFRDEAAWAYVRREVVPRVLSHKKPGDHIRVWSAGCASGEEAYSLAILLAEAMGANEFRRTVKIYATDVDEDALARARSATYSTKQVEEVPADLRETYFEQAPGGFAFRADLRRAVIFGRHDLVQDAPISRLDLLSCRNTLMYFNSETQGRILTRFHFALNDDGVLFMGKAEMLLTHVDLFSPLEMAHRLFTKTPRPPARERLLTLFQTGDVEALNHLGRHLRLRELSFDCGHLPQVIIDLDGTMVLANERARDVFALTPMDIGRPLRDLELSRRLGQLRTLVEQAYAERRSVTLSHVETWQPNGDTQYLNLYVTPLVDNGGTVLGMNIIFEDVTREHGLIDDLQRSTQELEAAYQELQSTHEEVETTNEELQSSNEELETTNEELQSANEELETMNEELQSTNEELQTLNVEMRERTDETRRTADFLQAILRTMPAAVVVVDNQFQVLVWNHTADEMWGLRSDEVVGRSIFSLDIGLPIDQLPLAAVVAGKVQKQNVTVAATNRRGKSITCQVQCSEFLGLEGKREGVVLLIEETPL